MKKVFTLLKVTYRIAKSGAKKGNKLKKSSYKFMDSFMSGLWKGK